MSEDAGTLLRAQFIKRHGSLLPNERVRQASATLSREFANKHDLSTSNCQLRIEGPDNGRYRLVVKVGWPYKDRRPQIWVQAGESDWAQMTADGDSATASFALPAGFDPTDWSGTMMLHFMSEAPQAASAAD